MSEERSVTFVLTGPREGFTGVLGGRYGFKDGRLKVTEKQKEAVKRILCTAYACNIEGEAPLWKTVKADDGKKASVAVDPSELKAAPKKEATSEVKSQPQKA